MLTKTSNILITVAEYSFRIFEDGVEASAVLKTIALVLIEETTRTRDKGWNSKDNH